VAVLALAACRPDVARDVRAGERALARMNVTQRADARVIGAESLSANARITAVFPEPDGDAVAFLFTEPARGVSSGLAIAQRRRPAPELLWPDSVTGVGWRGHSVAFRTMTGIAAQAVVDVHAETISVRPAAPELEGVMSATSADAASAATAITSWIDSALGAQMKGSSRPQLLSRQPSPNGKWTAFYAAPPGADNSGAWYAMETGTGRVLLLEDASAGQLSPSAGGWAGDSLFVFARGRTLFDARPPGAGTP